MTALVAILLAQAASAGGLRLKDEGTTLGYVDAMNFAGAGVTCTKIGNTGTCTIPGGGGGTATPGGSSGNIQTNDGAGGFGAYGGASCAYAVKTLDASGAATCTSAPTIPTDLSAEPFITKTASSNLSNEFALGSLATGLLKNTTTTGIPTIAVAGTDFVGPTSGSAVQLGNGAGGLTGFAGSNCAANQYAIAVGTAGAVSCAQVATSQLSGTITNAQLASSYSGVGACASGRFASTLNANASPTCTQVAYGDVSGTPTIPTDISGASFITKVAEASLSNEFALGSLTTGILLNTTVTGVPTIYAGTSCTSGQYMTALNSSGVKTCAQIAYSELSGTPTIPADISGAHYVTTQAEAGLSAEAVLPTCTGTDKLTFNGTTISCAADAGGSASPGGSSGDIQINSAGSFGAYAGTECPTGKIPSRVTSSGAFICVVPLYSTVMQNGADQTPQQKLNFIPGQNTYVSCTDNPILGSTDCTIGSSIRFVSVTVDFGSGGSDVAKTVVTGQGWVTTGSAIVCAPTSMLTDANLRPEGAEDAALEGLVVTASNRVAGTGFTVTAAPRFGKAYRSFIIHCTGGST